MENRVGQILELLEQRIPFDGGHVKTSPSKLHEEHQIDIEMVGLDVNGIKKVATNSPKFVNEDEIRNMNDKESMETLRLRKTKSILTPPNAKAVAKKRAKLLFDNLLDQLGGNVVPETPKVSGMPTFGIPVQDGGIGFDYRLHMAIAD
ncbi:hypothetical protein LOK49_LG08G03040 [Camellia lanceoleosa]|uniref:Uncharacterized protein n=1 Tax=Camellia lanceoleosa TaxID=1840588 RepID=A0ACC0GQS5_9ERIC|nr:hypothetical protein LOK49_LG08G03040 [Camellia lanceoleosa]